MLPLVNKQIWHVHNNHILHLKQINYVIKTSSAETKFWREDQPSDELQCASSSREYLMPLTQGCVKLKNRNWLECQENENSKLTLSFAFSERLGMDTKI